MARLAASDSRLLGKQKGYDQWAEETALGTAPGTLPTLCVACRVHHLGHHSLPGGDKKLGAGYPYTCAPGTEQDRLFLLLADSYKGGGIPLALCWAGNTLLVGHPARHKLVFHKQGYKRKKQYCHQPSSGLQPAQNLLMGSAYHPSPSWSSPTISA